MPSWIAGSPDALVAVAVKAVFIYATTYLMGAVALGTVLLAHAAITVGRGNRFLAKAVDHRVRVLVAHDRSRTRR